MAGKVVEKVLKALEKAMDVVAEAVELESDDKETILELLKKEMMVNLKDLKIPSSKKSPDGSSKSEKKPRKKSAYNFYIQDQFKKAKENESGNSTTELMSEFSKKWKNLPVDEKAPYQDMADKFNAENFADTGSDKGKPKKLNGYNVFMKEKMAEYKNGDLSPKDRLKKIAGEWKQLDQEEKDTFKEKAKVMSSGGDSDAEPEVEKKAEKKVEKKADKKVEKKAEKTPKGKTETKSPGKKAGKKAPEPESDSDSESDSD